MKTELFEINKQEKELRRFEINQQKKKSAFCAILEIDKQKNEKQRE